MEDQSADEFVAEHSLGDGPSGRKQVAGRVPWRDVLSPPSPSLGLPLSLCFLAAMEVSHLPPPCACSRMFLPWIHSPRTKTTLQP